MERLTAWLREITAKTDADAKDVIGGLFAIQAIRTAIAAARGQRRNCAPTPSSSSSSFSGSPTNRTHSPS